MDILAPQPTTEDVYSLGFDNSLNRTSTDNSTGVVYNAVNDIINSGQLTGIITDQLSGKSTTVDPTAKCSFSTIFEYITNRYTLTNVGTGSAGIGTTGMTIGTGAGATSSSDLKINISPSASNLLVDNAIFSARVICRTLNAASGDGSAYFGTGVTVNGAGHSFTASHAGFKIVKSGGTVGLYASQALTSVGIERTSALMTTLAVNDVVELIFKVMSSNRIDYFYRINGNSSLSVPISVFLDNTSAGTTNFLQCSVSNEGTAFDYAFDIASLSYSR